MGPQHGSGGIRIIGLGPVQLTVRDPEPTVLVLTKLMGFREKGKYPSTMEGQPDIIVFETGEGGSGAEVHVETRADLPRERPGYGGVHRGPSGSTTTTSCGNGSSISEEGVFRIQAL